MTKTTHPALEALEAFDRIASHVYPDVYEAMGAVQGITDQVREAIPQLEELLRERDHWRELVDRRAEERDAEKARADELLAALEHCAEDLEIVEAWVDPNAFDGLSGLTQARAAIAKAKGEA